MPATPHIEKHFTAGATVRDIVIGMSDGLTVPFALAAGLSAAATAHTIANGIIVTAGLAEIAAGSIAMGLGGYLAARGDAEHYDVERKREAEEIIEKTDIEVLETTTILENYGLDAAQARAIVEGLRKRPEDWIDFMMRFELGLEEPDRKRARVSALTIACSYIVGGVIPLSPYMMIAAAQSALFVSVGLTLAALFVFGFVKGKFTGTPPLRSALQTTAIGGIAAAAAFGLARWIS